MFGLIVRFTIKGEDAKNFDRLIEMTVPEIHRHERGTVVYAVHQGEGEANARICYELYRGREAFAAHESQAHTQRFLVERERYLSGPPQVDFLARQTAAGAFESR